VTHFASPNPVNYSACRNYPITTLQNYSETKNFVGW